MAYIELKIILMATSVAKALNITSQLILVKLMLNSK
jgi:hypothetical protein